MTSLLAAAPPPARAGFRPELANPYQPLLDVSELVPEVAVSRLVEHALDTGSSDVFLTSTATGVAVRVRHLGMVRTVSTLGADLGRRCQAHIKARSSMDLTERRRPTDGRWLFRRPDGRVADLRVGSIPTLNGEDIALRLLSRDRGMLRLDRLGMTPEQLSAYEAMIESPGGLVLVTGPTGSGKTSTLYASLARLNTGERKINTIEDPVEFEVEGMHQSQVNPAIDLGFSDLLRSVLRQSPDVIMIGEIRDAATAQLAVHAANTGILVFATLHAQSAPGAVQSMRSLGAHPHLFAAALRGVVAQRLVRTLCPACRSSFDLADAPHTFDEVRPYLQDGEGRVLYGTGGCPACEWSGFTGRTGVFEVMPATPLLREAIADAQPASDVQARAVADGMMQFRHAALLKVARGETCTEEVFRVVPADQLVPG